MRHIWPSFCLLAVFTLLCGFAYPLAMIQFGQTFFPDQANGSVMERDGQVLGSYLLSFPSDKGENYFHSRPSNAVIDNGVLVGLASNYAQTNSELAESHKTASGIWKEQYPNTDLMPTEMTFASASGLDPNISYDAAMIQAIRVSENRKIPIDDLYIIIDQYRKQVPLLKLDYVNVNRLNRALDQIQPIDDGKP
ncbi:MAG: potassium-transporting ATPase subunit C [Alphaproteobacteria bacterium]|nr:MAG: potassium-transporting ATPase subunit C [Alphaproteobacteria bacterium]